MAARFAGEPGTVVLLSGGDLDCARYHILALRPWLMLTGWLGKASLIVDQRAVDVTGRPLDVLQALLDRCRLECGDVTDPVVAGLFGYLAYDLKDDLERLPRTCVDDLKRPTLYLAAPSVLVVHDKVAGTTHAHVPIRGNHGAPEADEIIEAFSRELKTPQPTRIGFSADGGRLISNFSRNEYEAAVGRIREYIAAGDVYQVNLSQRFEARLRGDAYDLFLALYKKNPAPFFAFVNTGDHQIVSTSPERFILRSGNRVETRPIKGTRPRGRTPEQDEKMKAELSASPKDDAELSMIVDLLRNDIGKVCAGGSVVVAQHKRLEVYRNVYHLVSVVEGTLAQGKDAVDLIRATFPGGSITGCPKIRSMEIIDELETHRRHVYTGSIGYVSFHDTMDLSIAIRTATILGDRIVFSVGGGIVYDSDPADEYEETLHKGRTLMTVFEGTHRPETDESASGPWVWMNGKLISQEQAMVPATDLGMQYGFGLFETIRVEKGAVCRLQAHLDRFHRSWKTVFDEVPPDVTWRDIIVQVVMKNGLGDVPVAVKIMATRGTLQASPFNGTLLVTARPYLHKLTEIGAEGLRLATYEHPRLTPLADHKSLNYLYYHQAGAWARKNGADEAVILNPDGTVSETHTANLLVVRGRTVTRPLSPYVLPGVMQAAACRRLEKLGYTFLEEPVRPKGLRDADAVLLTNALMGVVPAFSLDNRPLKTNMPLIENLNRWLFSHAACTHGLR
ncbi:MAG: aminodeoxychorismate synthase, component I [Proteobacteria bacterium]|nr:MAG: aminodeoxychorismate synthase, component I [Pseudomonadota bacterium]PIE67946.1 MAG: aminodeoxychorismate synthase, component I [Deltaproteobacteria bacterium]